MQAKAPKTTQVTPATPEKIATAVQEGRALVDQGKTKVEAAMAIFCLIGDQEQKIVLSAFVTGASLTEKGSLTYWYNCKRKTAKEKKKAE